MIKPSVNKVLNIDINKYQNDIEKTSQQTNRYISYKCKIDELSEAFDKGCEWNKNDKLFFALVLMLHALRIIFQKKIDFDFKQIDSKDRLKSDEKNKNGRKSGKYYEEEAQNNVKRRKGETYVKNKKEEYESQNHVSDKERYLTWYEILMKPVPYDAMHAKPGTIPININNINGYGKELTGKNHHVATLGHDPILGLLFGTMNIMTRTITYINYSSFYVESLNQLDKRSQWVDYNSPYTLLSIFEECVDSTRADPARLAAAIARQIMHIKSDELTKQGLPFPFLSSISNETAQKLIDSGWNSNELKRLTSFMGEQLFATSQQVALSEFIRELSSYLYMLAFYSDDQEQMKFNEIKIATINYYANMLATDSSFIVALLTSNPSLMDFGGVITTIHQFININKVYEKIRDDLVYKKHYEIFSNYVLTGEI